MSTCTEIFLMLLTTRTCARRAGLMDSLANRNMGLSAALCSSYIIIGPEDEVAESWCGGGGTS